MKMTDSNYSTLWGCNMETERGGETQRGGTRRLVLSNMDLYIQYLFICINKDRFMPVKQIEIANKSPAAGKYSSGITLRCLFGPTCSYLEGSSATGNIEISVSEGSAFCRRRCPAALGARAVFIILCRCHLQPPPYLDIISDDLLCPVNLPSACFFFSNCAN